MAFYHVPTEFLLAIVCARTALPLRALSSHLPSLLALRFHRALSRRTPYNVHANATDNHRVHTATSVQARGAPVAL